MRTLVLDPNARVQWGERIAVVHTSASPQPTGRAHGLLISPVFCSDLAHAARRIDVVVYAIDDRLLEVDEEPDGGIALHWLGDAPRIQRIRVAVDLWSARLALADGDGGHDWPSPQESAVWLDAVRPTFDGALLDGLWQRATAAKGADPEERRSWLDPHWSRGDLVAWHDVRPLARPDLYALEHMTVMAAEQWCVMPTCDCRKTTLTFHRFVEPPPGGDERRVRTAEIIGHVDLPLDGDTFKLVVRPGHPRQDVVDAWDQYVQRWPHHRRRLHERYIEVRHTLAEVVRARLREREPGAASLMPEPSTSARRTTTKVGRNAPCPCGSGRKYKRCCWANDAMT